VAATVKLQKFVTNEPNFSPSEQSSDKQHQLRLSSLYPWHIWCQHYVTTSKKYLINCHILLQYFELVFFELQLVKILCKLIIIWVNYQKNKKGSLLWNSVYNDGWDCCIGMLVQLTVADDFHVVWYFWEVITRFFLNPISNCFMYVSATYIVKLTEEFSWNVSSSWLVFKTRSQAIFDICVYIETVNAGTGLK